MRDRRRKLLFVSNDSEFRQSVRAVLADLGFRAVTVPHPPAIREAATGRRPDVVVVDLWPPTAAQFAALRELRRLVPRVVVVSAHLNDAELSAVHELRVDGVLLLPYDVEDLADVVTGFAPDPQNSERTPGCPDMASDPDHRSAARF